MSCSATTAPRSSAPIASRPTDIYRRPAAKCVGPICGAPLRTSWRAAARRPVSVRNCWSIRRSCLPGGIESAMAPCNCRASRFTSVAICASGFVSNSGMGSSSPTPRRPQPAAICSPSSRPCGPSCARTATSSPRTTRPSAAFGMESCGALPASAPTAPTEPLRRTDAYRA